MAGSSAELEFRDIVVVGGGCYGSFYAGQLAAARHRGAIRYRRVIVVDRNPQCTVAAMVPDALRELHLGEWSDFFDGWLGGEAGEGDAIVPSPLMPHLMFEWLERRARLRWPHRIVERVSLDTAGDTPYDVLHADGTRYLSYADWICPVHCIEPASCPMIRAPRTWEMREAVADLVRRRAADRRIAGPLVFHCRHRAFGVGMFDVAEVLDADRQLQRAGTEAGPFEAVIGTISSCHGAVSAFHVSG
ncbi:MAG TPA: hypothetical protein VFK36_03625 [Gemmatimonadales bacterium]|nr:hypothetical protein [Gemmatimonadales bacterium]